MQSESQGEKTQGTSTQQAWHLTVYLGSLKKINFPSKVKLPNLVFLSTWKSGAREKIVFLSALITRLVGLHFPCGISSLACRVLEVGQLVPGGLKEP